MALKASDLIPAGRLAYYPGDEGWMRFQPDTGVSGDLPEDVFLFFHPHKVWYVTIAERKIMNGKQLLRFSEPEVMDAVRENGRISLMLDPGDDASTDDPLPDLQDREVWFNGILVGRVTDWFSNGAQWVIVIGEGDSEFMVPFVDEFIADTTGNRIVLRNAEELIPPCVSMS
jgi:ribosomal 30S subunit maturation factor RimM